MSHKIWECKYMQDNLEEKIKALQELLDRLSFVNKEIKYILKG